jgi:hypothetical protein
MEGKKKGGGRARKRKREEEEKEEKEGSLREPNKRQDVHHHAWSC